jgi:hypothetical protein
MWSTGGFKTALSVVKRTAHFKFLLAAGIGGGGGGGEPHIFG